MSIAYGFIGLQHLFKEVISDSRVATVTTAVTESVAEHNRQAEALVDEIAMMTTDYKIRFQQYSTGTLQPLDEWGNPLPVRPEGYFDVAFPIQGGGSAWGDNRVTRALMTIEQANRNTVQMFGFDADWVKRHVLAAVLDNTSGGWDFVDPEHGTLTIQPLANADGTLYPLRTGAAADLDHYYAQAAAIDDSNNPFPTIYTSLNQVSGNAAPYVAYVASDLVSSIMGLANFIPVSDARVVQSVDSDRLNASVGRGFGDEYLGYVDKIDIVEWSMMPSGYGLVVSRGAAQKPLGMRQYPAAALQGLFTENNSPDGNLFENRYIRYAGFGGNNRVAALVFQIGNATYQIPAGYAAPLLV